MEQAIVTHKQAVEASLAERKEKLQQLAADLVKLQVKMSEVETMSSSKAKLATHVQELAAKQRSRKLRHDHAARSPRPLRMGGDEVPRGESKVLVQPDYYASSVPVAKVHHAKARKAVAARKVHKAAPKTKASTQRAQSPAKTAH